MKNIPLFAMAAFYGMALISLILWQIFGELELWEVWFGITATCMVFNGFLYLGAKLE